MAPRPLSPQAVLAMKLPRNLVLYDPLCYYTQDRLTKALARSFTLDNKDPDVFHVAARDSMVGRAVLKTQPPAIRDLDSIFLVEKRPKRTFFQRLLPGLAGQARADDYELHVYVKAQAIFRIVGLLDDPQLRYVGKVAYWVVPKRVADGVFDWIAKSRYEKFGKSETGTALPMNEEFKARTWKF